MSNTKKQVFSLLLEELIRLETCGQSDTSHLDIVAEEINKLFK